MSIPKFCDENCNKCELINSKNSRQLTHLLSYLVEIYGDDLKEVIMEKCPNLSVCADCGIDDFCHIEGCKLSEIDF